MSNRRDSENTEPPSESSDPNSGDDSVWATDDDYIRGFDVYPEETECHNKRRQALLYPASSDQVAYSGEELREPPLPYREESLKTTGKTLTFEVRLSNSLKIALVVSVTFQKMRDGLAIGNK